MKTPDESLGALRQSPAGSGTALYQPFLCRACALAALALSGCGSPVPNWTTEPVNAAAQTQEQTPTHKNAAPVPTAPAANVPRQAWRVIVQFRPGVAYRDSAFLQAMGEKVQARIVYLASVSDDTHVYRIEPRAGLSEAEMVRRLAGLPSVRHAEIDARVRPL